MNATKAAHKVYLLLCRVVHIISWVFEI